MEINFRKCKWLLFATCHPPLQCDKYFFDYLSRSLDIGSALHKFVLIQNFNAKESEDTLACFFNCHNVPNRVKDEACFKSSSNLSFIDLIITNNKPAYFQNILSFLLNYQISYFVTTILKASFKKALLKKVFYRNYKHLKISKKNYMLNLVASLKTMMFLITHF